MCAWMESWSSLARCSLSARDGWRRDRCSLQKQVLMAAQSAAPHADKLEITIFDGCLDATQNTKRVCLMLSEKFISLPDAFQGKNVFMRACIHVFGGGCIFGAFLVLILVACGGDCRMPAVPVAIRWMTPDRNNPSFLELCIKNY